MKLDTDKKQELNRLVEEAKEGNYEALETLLRAVQNQVYNLALRMLWLPADAQDATQEILIKVFTHLSEFRQESAFTTWVYRIASNYLLTTRKRRAEMRETTFDSLGDYIDRAVATTAASGQQVEDRVLNQEIKLTCTLAMLLCLDREDRLTYILGQIFQVSSEQGAYLMDTTPAAFRKRLSRARQKLRDFVSARCGIYNPANPCRCSKIAAYKLETGELRPQKLFLASSPVLPQEVEEAARQGLEEMYQFSRMAALFRSHPAYASPQDFTLKIRQLITSGDFRMLRD
ncbi:MAG TPA: RNA polymerase sigma factor [Chloroflexia bacterium]|nr:RNA polymerase sigma factor [Chloroflexia bacterium]